MKEIMNKTVMELVDDILSEEGVFDTMYDKFCGMSDKMIEYEISSRGQYQLHPFLNTVFTRESDSQTELQKCGSLYTTIKNMVSMCALEKIKNERYVADRNYIDDVILEDNTVLYEDRQTHITRFEQFGEDLITVSPGVYKCPACGEIVNNYYVSDVYRCNHCHVKLMPSKIWSD